MRKLLDGILDFHDRRLPEYKDRFAELAGGQNPDELFVACCDSRVEVDLFCEVEPGEMFELRNVGNMIPPYAGPRSPVGAAGAALEYAVLVLEVRDIVILGHSECGAMKAILAEHPVPAEAASLTHWIGFGRDAVARLDHDGPLDGSLPRHDQLSQVNVLAQLDHASSYPSVAARLADGRLRTHGLWFDVATGEVHGYAADTHRFARLDAELADRMAVRGGTGDWAPVVS